MTEILPLGPEGLRQLKERQPNPCVTVYGPDPEGRRCGDGCRNLYAKHYHRTFYKCRLRGDTNGEGTDHRRRWPACARFEVES